MTFICILIVISMVIDVIVVIINNLLHVLSVVTY